jgi:hypothetical protein
VPVSIGTTVAQAPIRLEKKIETVFAVSSRESFKMKRFGLGVLGFLVFANVGQAALPILDTRLEIKVTPIKSHFGNATVIDIYSNGEVYGNRNRTTPVLIEKLSADKMDQIESLIQEAANEEVPQPDPHSVHCMAMPINKIMLTADNGNLLLESGAVPCGTMTRREGTASDQLVDILQAEQGKFNQMTP